MAHQERTFIAVKPDGVQRGLVGEIIKRFEQKGFRLVAMKFLQVTRRAAGVLLLPLPAVALASAATQPPEPSPEAREPRRPPQG
uniref:nucleoside diphosphate kinase B-like n=1 Tax=Panthera onca TaxID=9690 RepID=UPI002955D3DE|nr:nucleoside diphosphate kinase B-like [Panthera onca]